MRLYPQELNDTVQDGFWVRQGIAIVGREHCFESSKELPIGRTDEAIKAAQMLDDTAPFTGKTYFIVEDMGNARCRVYFFTIQQSIYEQLHRRAWFILPESLLVKLWLDKKRTGQTMIMQTVLGERALAVFKTPTLFRTFLGKVDEFEAANMMPLDLPTINNREEVIDTKYHQLLVSALALLPVYLYSIAVNKTRFNQFWQTIPWRNSGIIAGILGALYLGLSSLYLTYMKDDIEQQLSEQHQQLDNIFALQRKIDLETNLINQMAKNNKLQRVTSYLWPMVFKLIEQQIEIMTVRIEGSDYILRVKSEKATQVMDVLSKMSAVVSPEMISPVVNRQNKEIVTVQFKIIADSDTTKGEHHVGT